MDQDQAICKVHQKELKYFYQGSEEKQLKIFCELCKSENKNSDDRNFVKIKQAKLEFKDILENAYNQDLNKKQLSELINKKVQNIIDQLDEQKIIIEQLHEDILSYIRNDLQEIESLKLADVKTLNYEQIKMYAELFYQSKNNEKILDQIQQKINSLVQNLLDMFSQKQSEIAINLQFVKEQLVSFKNQLVSQEELMLQSVKFGGKYDIFEYLPSISTLVTVSNCELQVLKIDQQTFKLQQKIEQAHKINTFSFSSKNKKLYFGTKNFILIYKYQNQTYVLEKQITVNDEIEKIILDPTDSTFFAQSRNKILVFDNLTLNLKQYLEDKRMILKNINCFEINTHGSYLILQNEKDLSMWDEQYSFWKLRYIQKIQVQTTSICFLNSYQFCSLDKNGNIFLWEINQQQLIELHSLQAIPGTLKFNQTLKILMCYNQNLYQCYQLQDVKNFIFKQQKMGKDMNFSVPLDGEEFAFCKGGQIYILQLIEKNDSMRESNFFFIKINNKNNIQVLMPDFLMEPDQVIVKCKDHPNKTLQFLIRDEQNQISTACHVCQPPNNIKEKINFLDAYTEYQTLYIKRKEQNSNKVKAFQKPISKFLKGITDILDEIQQRFAEALQKISQKESQVQQSFLNHEKDNIFLISKLDHFQEFGVQYFKYQDWLRDNQTSNEFQNEKLKKQYFDNNYFMKLRKDFVDEIQVIHGDILKHTYLNFKELNLYLEILEKNINSSFFRNQHKKSIITQLNLRNEVTNLHLNKNGQDFLLSSANSLSLYSIEKKIIQDRNTLKFDEIITNCSVNENFNLFAISTSGQRDCSLHFGNILIQQRELKKVNQFSRTNIKAMRFAETEPKLLCLVFNDDAISIYHYKEQNWVFLRDVSLQNFSSPKFNEDFSVLGMKQSKLTTARQIAVAQNQFFFYLTDDLMNKNLDQMIPIQINSKQFNPGEQYDYFWLKNCQKLNSENLYIFQENQLFQFKLEKEKKLFQQLQTTTVIKGNLVVNDLIEKYFAIKSTDNMMICIYKIVQDKVFQVSLIQSELGFTLEKFSTNEQFLSVVEKKKVNQKLIIYHNQSLPQLNLIPISSPQITFKNNILYL